MGNPECLLMKYERVCRMALAGRNAAQIIQSFRDQPAIVKALRNSTDLFEDRASPCDIP
jgi:hypothetical protein